MLKLLVTEIKTSCKSSILETTGKIRAGKLLTSWEATQGKIAKMTL